MPRGLSRSRSKSRVITKGLKSIKRTRSLSSPKHPLYKKIKLNIPLTNEEKEMIEDMAPEDMEEGCPTTEVPDVMEKYVIVSRIVNKALDKLLELCQPGADVAGLCEAGDAFIEKECGEYYSKKKDVPRGVAFPTCVSVNKVIAHCAPLKAGAEELADDGDEAMTTASVKDIGQPAGFVGSEKPTIIADGNVVRIDLSAHIDGFIATVTHSTVISTSEIAPPEIDPRLADVLVAAQTAVDAVIHTMRPGNTNAQATDVIRLVADNFGVEPLEGVLSHRMAGGVIDGPSTIICRRVVDHEPQQDVETCTFGPNQVWAIHVAMSTGGTRLRQSAEDRTHIWKRNDVEWEPKRKGSKLVLSQLKKRVIQFPFHQRVLESPTLARMGVFELAKLSMLEPYPVFCCRPSEHVARVKVTVVITDTGVKALTGHALPSWIRSQRKVQPSVDAILSTSLMFSAQKALKKAKKNKVKHMKASKAMSTE